MNVYTTLIQGLTMSNEQRTPLVITNLEPFNLYTNPPGKDAEGKWLPFEKLLWSTLGGSVLSGTIFHDFDTKEMSKFNMFTVHFTPYSDMILEHYKTAKPREVLTVSGAKNRKVGTETVSVKYSLGFGISEKGTAYLSVSVDGRTPTNFPFTPMEGTIIDNKGVKLSDSDVSRLMARSYWRRFFDSVMLAHTNTLSANAKEIITDDGSTHSAKPASTAPSTDIPH